MATADKPIFPDPRDSSADKPSSSTTSGPQIVFPDSGRFQVKDTKMFPFVCSGMLLIEFPNPEETYTGTGVLIAPEFVLTAAHNLWDGVKPRKLTYFPAVNGDVLPFEPVAYADFRVPELYKKMSPPPPNREGNISDDTKYIYDYGLIRLQRRLAIPFLDGYAASDRQLPDLKVRIAGYPGDKPPRTMWQSEGRLQPADSEHLLFYRISTFGGQSGAALMTEVDGGLRVVGVHIAGSPKLDCNFAVRLNPDVLNEIRTWMKEMGDIPASK